MEVSGAIPFGQALTTSAWTFHHLLGRAMNSVAHVIFVPVAVATILIAEDDIQAGGSAGVVVAVLFPLFIVWLYFVHPLLLRRRWKALTGSPHVVTRYRISDDGLHVDSDASTMVVHWPAVLQLVRGGPYWQVMLPDVGLPIPRRFFVDPPAERAFIRACLEHLSPEALARSQKAVTFTKKVD